MDDMSKHYSDITRILVTDPDQFRDGKFVTGGESHGWSHMALEGPHGWRESQATDESHGWTYDRGWRVTPTDIGQSHGQRVGTAAAGAGPAGGCQLVRTLHGNPAFLGDVTLCAR